MKGTQCFVNAVVLAIVFSDIVNSLADEPVCSKFDYEYKTLEAMLRIENRAEKMMEEMKSVRDSMTKELIEIKNLKDDVERQLSAMERKITAQQEYGVEQRVMQEKMVEEMKSVRDSMTKGFTETERQRNVTESKIVALESQVEETRQSDEVIAFSVTSPTKDFVKGVPIFSTVITNIGNGYDVDTGIFTCPVDGLYMFVFTVASLGKYDMYCFIGHNGNNKVFGRSYSDNSYTTAAASVNLMLRKGDLVTLGHCYGWSNVDYSTFSGVLLQKTDSEN